MPTYTWIHTLTNFFVASRVFGTMKKFTSINLIWNCGCRQYMYKYVYTQYITGNIERVKGAREYREWNLSCSMGFPLGCS